MKKESSSEFRSCHAAKEALLAYKKCDRDISVIKNIPHNHIDRYDVWCVTFEGETEACRELKIKELYSTLKSHDIENHPETSDLVGIICIRHIIDSIEFNLPLKMEEIVKIMLDIQGEKFLKQLKKSAKYMYDLRVNVVKPYYKPDGEWVGYTKKLIDYLDML